jgi:hypothetical protein
MLLLWGLQSTQWSRAYSFWRGLPIVPGWIGPSSIAPLHFWAHLGPPGFLVPPPQLIPMGLLNLRGVLPTWCLMFAYGSSWVPSKTPKKWIELYRSSDTKWRAPKFLVRPKLGLSYSTMELWGIWSTLPTLNTRRDRWACWSSRMGLGRVTSFIYLLEPA